jgi:hypothetical protein
MEEEIINHDVARNNTLLRDSVRHSMTIKQAGEVFALLGVSRSNRSIQRFCEQGYLDCIRVKGPKGDQFFINRESVERYAEELKQIAATASASHIDTARHDARSSAPDSDSRSSVPHRAEPMPPSREDSAELPRLRDENLNLRIDNRGKEQAINFLTAQLSTKDQQLQDLSYRLGAAETRVTLLEAPKPEDDTARQTATETAMAPAEAIIMPASPEPKMESSAPEYEPTPRRSFFGRLFG